MPLFQSGSLIGQSIYVSLKARAVQGTYHWGLLVMDSETEGIYHHATNLSGGWEYVVERAPLENWFSLVAAIRADGVSDGISAVTDVLQSIPADGSPSRRTGEPFSCRTWVEDALVALDGAGIIQLPTSIDDFVRLAEHYGRAALEAAECGLGATLVNEPDLAVLSNQKTD